MNGSGAFLGDSSHESLEGLIGRIPAKRLPRTVVHQIGHGVQRILVMHAQVCALGHELAQQPIRVLTTAFLPLLLRATLPPALAADLGPLFAEVSMYALMAAVLAFRPAGLFSAKA